MFYRCEKLKTVIFGKNLTYISESSAFKYCNALESIYFKGTEAQWAAITGTAKTINRKFGTEKAIKNGTENSVPFSFGFIKKISRMRSKTTMFKPT